MPYIPPHKFPDKLHLSVSEQYFDRVQVWLTKPLNGAALTSLGGLCRGGIHLWKRPMEYAPRFCQRIQLIQPTLNAFQALNALARDQEVMINAVELSCDVVGHDDLKEILAHGWVRKWHRAEHGVRWVKGQTRYDVSRRARNQTVLYSEGFSRMTGEINCIHIEWRAQTVGVVRGLGIEAIPDLITFDHAAFWKSKLLVYNVNEQKLGMLFRNHRHSTRDRLPRFRRYSTGCCINVDHRLGRAIHVEAGSVQTLLDSVKDVRVQRALERVDVVLA